MKMEPSISRNHDARFMMSVSRDAFQGKRTNFCAQRFLNYSYRRTPRLLLK